MQRIFNNDGFNWWLGVVEDREDPEKLGRVKIRIFGYHTDDQGDLPTEELQWAWPIQPITSAALSGVGQTPIGPLEGSWVIGFFLDGADMQQPAYFGTLASKVRPANSKPKDKALKAPGEQNLNVNRIQNINNLLGITNVEREEPED